jgi:endonuclease/exonuclease/phosphatase family metal-dependent hydrolase
MAILLTWNVAGRVGPNQERQVAALAERAFDVLCLQEVTPRTRARWVEALEGRGLHVAVSEWPVAPSGTRRFAVLVASRRPVRPRPGPGLPWPERHLAVRTAVDCGGGGVEVEVHTLHAPLSSKEELAKVRTLEALHAQLAAPADGVPRILAGDLNTPRYESREGEIITFARDRKGRLREELGARHDRAELLLIDDLVRAHGWRDAFRAVHGYARRDRSWAMPTGFGWRLDHIIASPGLEPVDADYVHEWRTERLSDHSAMWARLEPPTPPRTATAAPSRGA